ncbi:MAG: ABC transporter substrate-binding protein [Pseudomonadales bacterium]|nr:ABC transporter substrate-binding protein [Pseudomonadales bacterium]
MLYCISKDMMSLPTFSARPLLYLALVAAILLQSSPLRAAESDARSVHLQLKWKHAFQFAGYYMAKERGFYDEVGLDVKISEFDGGKLPVDRLVDGEVDFAILGSSIVIERARGKPVIALAAIFQHSPYAFLVRADSGINRVEDFAGKRVMLGSGVQDAELEATLLRAGIGRNDYVRVPTSFDAQDLINGRTDVFNAYVTDQGFMLQEQGIEGRYLMPSQYGVDFYGDTLATTESYQQEHPQVVRKFRRASLKGWEYALAHRDEAIDVILRRYNSQMLSRSHLEYEADASRELIQPILVSIGYMNPARWQHIRDVFASLQLLDPDSPLDGLIYQDQSRRDLLLEWVREHIVYLVSAIASVLGLVLIILVWHLRQLVRLKSTQLGQREEYLRLIIETVPLCIKTEDTEGRCLSINAAGLEMIEADSEEEAQKVSMLSLVDEDFRDTYEQAVTQALQGETGSCEFRIHSLMGSERWLESRIVPMRDKQGEVTGVLMATMDVTQRYAMALKVSEQIERMDYLLDNIRGVCWEYDIHAQCYSFISASADKLLGVSGSDWADPEKMSLLIHEDDRRQRPDLQQSTPQFDKDCSREYRVRRPDGVELWVLEIITLIRNNEGETERIVGFMLDITARKSAEIAVQESEARYRAIFEGAPQGLLMMDSQLTITGANDQLCTLLGVADVQLKGTNARALFPESEVARFEREMLALRDRKHSVYESTLITHRKLPISAGLSASALLASDGTLNAVVLFITDLTEKVLAERTLRRVQKMDAVGQLTGGIAHDFNNILNIVQGNIDLMEISREDGGGIEEFIEGIKQATTRAGRLTQQLLSFARQQQESAVVCDINNSVRQLDTLIDRSITPTVKVCYDLEPELWRVRIDDGDLQDAILNLALNARDAMQGTGILTISTRNFIADEAFCAARPQLKAGEYVRLGVTDTGSGITAEQQERIFEPFYTTKQRGRGTGLGLPMVFGFVQRSGGHIEVVSEVGAGARFDIYLPRTRDPLTGDQDQATGSITQVRGTETILLVDDEEDLRHLSMRALERFGYRVITAADGAEAIAILQSDQPVDMLFSDIVMPGGYNGYEVADAAREFRPNIKVLLTTGYVDDKLYTTYAETRDYEVLRKPYSVSDLTDKISDVMTGHD